MVILLMATLAACGGGNTTPEEEVTYDNLVLMGAVDTRAILMEREEQIASCMAGEGFEYVPYVPRDPVSVTPDVGTLASIPDPDYVRENGYGFAVSIEISRIAEAEDPNVAIVNNLADEERAEYHEALLGTVGNETVGCARRFDNETYQSVIAEQKDLVSEASIRLHSDPRYIDIEVQWSRCMAEQGYDFRDRFQAIVEYFGPQVSDLASSFDEAKLESLRQEEIRIAEADVACVEPVGDELRALAREYEEAILEEAAGLFSQIGELEEQYGSR